MVARATVARVAENRFAAAGVALVIIVAAITFAVATDREEDLGSRIAQSGPETSGAQTTKEKGGSQPTAQTPKGGVPATSSGREVAAVIPGLPGSPGAKPCRPQHVTETGVTDDAITIGQVVTDSNQIPQQLRPAHEGLEAFVKLFNSHGGLCGRELKLEYRNDNLNPATHSQDTRELASRALAFVGNESLLDFLDYNQDPPFEPTVRGGSGFVPDVGGLAFGYPRSQSRWHAGVVGSVSPTLVGGGEYKFFMAEAKARNKPCRKGAVIYLREPTGASEDQARLGQVSLEESWGGGLGRGNTQLYATNLQDPVPAYEALVDRMVADGMNCVFTYTDLQSSINLAQAMNNRGVWPPDRCKLGNRCFRVTYVPLSAYDAKFIRDGGEGARFVSTFIPHVPLNEAGNPAMRVYLNALKDVPGATPSTFSIFGFGSGVMLVAALQGCASAPTRTCLIDALHHLERFTAGGLVGGTTPFRTTRATFGRYGTFDWKWIFNYSIAMRVLDRDGKRDFYRVNPADGFFQDTIKVARGTAS
jgi:hypothetical protein